MKRKINNKFVPRTCDYRIWWKHYAVQPDNTVVKYWELDENGNYCGVLRYKTGILYTIILLLFSLTMIYHLRNVNDVKVVVQSPKVITLSDGLLSININNILDDSVAIKFKIQSNGRVIYSGEIEPGHSIGTVISNLKMKPGSYPATIVYYIENEQEVSEANTLLIVK